MPRKNNVRFLNNHFKKALILEGPDPSLDAAAPAAVEHLAAAVRISTNGTGHNGRGSGGAPPRR